MPKTVNVSAVFFGHVENSKRIGRLFLAPLKTVNVSAAFFGAAENRKRIGRGFLGPSWTSHVPAALLGGHRGPRLYRPFLTAGCREVARTGRFPQGAAGKSPVLAVLSEARLYFRWQTHSFIQTYLHNCCSLHVQSCTLAAILGLRRCVLYHFAYTTYSIYKSVLHSSIMYTL